MHRTIYVMQQIPCRTARIRMAPRAAGRSGQSVDLAMRSPSGSGVAGCASAELAINAADVSASRVRSDHDVTDSSALLPIRFSFPEGAPACHLTGLSAVNGEQQGLLTGWNSINSTRVPSGSYKLACHLPSSPICGPSWRGLRRFSR